ncbi:uncharacterized protein P884DRAFT_158479, partial [Thermothelomyces heterothallicus CBS 202.75]|uniref:uncharacterized protein n=1 Tax=Thermothelomyces heterothallicus CBS 202.75 TaxID=1149848 RepID=UPI003743E0AA
INVGQNECKSADYDKQISTQGLATCIGIVAYGKHSADTRINKVMAHCSPGKVTYVIGHQFVTQVLESRMDISGISMSCATRTVNDDGPFRISDQDLRQAIATEHQIHPDQVTSQQIQEQRAGMRRLQDSAEAAAKLICRDHLGVPPTVYRRRNADVASTYPFGTVVATPSPQGIVRIDGNRVARIPDSAAPAPSASS